MLGHVPAKTGTRYLSCLGSSWPRRFMSSSCSQQKRLFFLFRHDDDPDTHSSIQCWAPLFWRLRNTRTVHKKTKRERFFKKKKNWKSTPHLGKSHQAQYAPRTTISNNMIHMTQQEKQNQKANNLVASCMDTPSSLSFPCWVSSYL